MPGRYHNLGCIWTYYSVIYSSVIQPSQWNDCYGKLLYSFQNVLTNVHKNKFKYFYYYSVVIIFEFIFEMACLSYVFRKQSKCALEDYGSFQNNLRQQPHFCFLIIHVYMLSVLCVFWAIWRFPAAFVYSVCAVPCRCRHWVTRLSDESHSDILYHSQWGVLGLKL